MTDLPCKVSPACGDGSHCCWQQVFIATTHNTTQQTNSWKSTPLLCRWYILQPRFLHTSTCIVSSDAVSRETLYTAIPISGQWYLVVMKQISPPCWHFSIDTPVFTGHVHLCEVNIGHDHKWACPWSKKYAPYKFWNLPSVIQIPNHTRAYGGNWHNSKWTIGIIYYIITIQLRIYIWVCKCVI